MFRKVDLGTHLGQGGLDHVCALFGLIELILQLAVLEHVPAGQLALLLGDALELLDLALELAD